MDGESLSAQRRGLDCVVIGYNDVDLRQVEEQQRAAQQHSGAYRNLCGNTIVYQGQRRHMMDVLNDAVQRATGSDPRLHVGHLPNLATHYLCSFLRERGMDAAPINFFNAQLGELEDMLAAGVTSVAITTTFYVEAGPIKEIVAFVRSRSPTTKVIVGGPHIFNVCSTYDEETQKYILDDIGADFYIYDSQGEATLATLVDAIRSGAGEDRLADIPNLIRSAKGSDVIRTERRVEDNDLNSAAIRWRHFPVRSFTPTAQMRTARSCAFKCSFCRYPVVAGGLNLTDLSVVEQELRELTQAGVRQVVFIDDTFNVPIRRFKDLCRLIIRNDFKISWYSYFRCANADEEAIELMHASGCAGVFLGIESADESVLQIMNKSASVDRYRRGITALKARGIMTFASLIIGFPGETAETVENTFRFLEETQPTYFRAELYYHDVNTPIQQRADEFQIRGAGYSWRHATMDWREASDHIDRLYRRVTGSTILPLYQFDFWSIPYLIGEGLAPEQIRQFLEAVRPQLQQGAAVDPAIAAQVEDRVMQVFSGQPAAARQLVS